MSIGIVAYGAVSPLGDGEGAIEAPTTGRVARDDVLSSAGLLRPFCARAAIAIPKERDRATFLLEHALASVMRELDRVMPEWRSRRVGCALGTSSGGMCTFESRYPSLPFEGTYLGPVVAAERVAFAPFALVLGACASSTLAIGLGRSWLELDRCDVVLAGGVDAVSTFVAAGFESLRATATERGPRPFREGRDGLALGEGAAIVALARVQNARIWVTGFGASCDAVHLTAPDRTGAGLTRAARSAIGSATEIGLVSAHGTATDFNDAAEALAIKACAPEAKVHALKGAIGHTLGAAGALELLSAMTAIEKKVAPPSVGEGTAIEGVNILDRAEPLSTKTVLKLSSAFGGTNAALVASLDPTSPPIEKRAVYVSRGVHVTAPLAASMLAARTGYAEDKIARADDLVRLALTAVAELEERVGPVRGAGIITGLGLATIDTNAAFLARIRERGAARSEPRLFPYTTPNAAGGECAVAFGLTGPMFAVGGGSHGGIEALAVASDLIATGVADRIVVVAADEGGAASRTVAPDCQSGAVALLVAGAPLEARIEAAGVSFGPGHLDEVPKGCTAHRALTPLATGRPEMLEVVLPWGGIAKAHLFWL